MRLMQLFTYLLLATVFVGCSTDQTLPEEHIETNRGEQQDDEATEDTLENIVETEEDLNIEPYKTDNIEEILQLEPGKYSEENYDEKIVKEAFYEFLGEVSTKDYLARLLALAQDDYRPLYKLLTEFDTSYADPSDAPDTVNPTVNGVQLGAGVNVAVLLDASGSMKAEIDGRSRMEHAKDAIQTFVSELPSDVNVSLHVYGHKGAGNEKDKALSCASTEVVYDLSPYHPEQFDTALNTFSPSGWTPLAASIAAAYTDLLANTVENTESIVYIVSDGVETCGGNPVEEAKKLSESSIKAIVNIIGFDVDTAGQNALKQVAEAGKGTYMTVTSQKEMEEFFKKEKRELEKEWIGWSSENISDYYTTQQEKITEVYAIVADVLEKIDNEKEKLLALVDSMEEEIGPDEESKRKMKNDIGYRSSNIRMHIRHVERELLKEIRANGSEVREDVRDKGAKEREKLKPPSNQ